MVKLTEFYRCKTGVEFQSRSNRTGRMFTGIYISIL
uniref:Uncharacterized protein n=1 Tax=Parascaris equorum TaxID=6256 RepID=A0A914RDX9_PAREQ